MLEFLIFQFGTGSIKNVTSSMSSSSISITSTCLAGCAKFLIGGTSIIPFIQLVTESLTSLFTHGTLPEVNLPSPGEEEEKRSKDVAVPLILF